MVGEVLVAEMTSENLEALPSQREIEELIYKEASLLDLRRYDEWLDLYSNNAIYWIPSWVSESELTTDPVRELSLLYLDRRSLEAYVKRILSGEAHTYSPPARTNRLVTNVLLEGVKDGKQVVSCHWLMHVFAKRTHEVFGGQLEYHIVKEQARLRIAFKKVILVNEWISGGQLLLV